MGPCYTTQLSHPRSPEIGPRQGRQPSPDQGGLANQPWRKPAWGLPRLLPLPTLVTGPLGTTWGRHLQVSLFLLLSDPEGKHQSSSRCGASHAPRVGALPSPPQIPNFPLEEMKLASWACHILVTQLSLYPSASFLPAPPIRQRPGLRLVGILGPSLGTHWFASRAVSGATLEGSRSPLSM